MLIDKDVFIISDTHFGHENMYKFEPLRRTEVIKSAVRNIDDLMIQRWNERVSSNDIVFHLGDFCMQNPPRDILKKLNGTKVLLRGNHDKGSTSFHLSQGWTDVIEGVHLSLSTSDKEEQILSLIQNEIAKNRLAHSLLNCLITDVDGQRIMFSHFPVFDNNPYDEKFNPITETLEEIYLLAECTLNIHGHVHSQSAKEEICINVCVEQIDFQPIRLTELIQKYRLVNS